MEVVIARFRVTRSFWHMARDLVVLTGEHIGDGVREGDTVELPGLGPAVVASAELVKMADGAVPSLIFPASIMEKAPLFDPATLDGRVIERVDTA